jgi:hypothetical protein
MLKQKYPQIDHMLRDIQLIDAFQQLLVFLLIECILRFYSVNHQRLVKLFNILGIFQFLSPYLKYRVYRLHHQGELQFQNFLSFYVLTFHSLGDLPPLVVHFDVENEEIEMRHQGGVFWILSGRL